MFEYHPENKGTPYEVLLSQLGTYRQEGRSQLAIPPPAVGQQQYGPLGSDSYLLWHEAPARVSPEGLPLPVPTASLRQPATLRGLHLPTGQVVGPISGLDNPLLAGTILVGTDSETRQLLAYDLTSGTRYPLSPTGGATARAAYGRTVAWAVPDPSRSGTSRILMQTLGGSPPQRVITRTGEITALALSADHLAWMERPMAGIYSNYSVYNLDRATGAIRTVGSLVPPFNPYYVTVPSVSLVGQLLYWTGGKIQETNLRTGTTRQVGEDKADNIFARPDVLLWLQPDPYRLWGQRLPDGAPCLLANGVAPGHGALAGSWLVYDRAQAVGLVTVRLDDLFRVDPPGIPVPPPTYPATDIPLTVGPTATPR